MGGAASVGHSESQPQPMFHTETACPTHGSACDTFSAIHTHFPGVCLARGAVRV